MRAALRAENLSKLYRIYDHPTDRLKEMVSRGHWKRHHEFWALRDIGFEVEKGTTTGIIGPNGSGKSTLLQIMTGTLEPTHGSVRREGRVAALLELGAGFNPEFTGTENVFMSGMLMGLSRKEINALLPEIERFAEIGPFIYQPVKTYSSGMYVRLAFSVAVSVSPEILIIDEALAVGDAVFQHRCMRRLKALQASGATILFVSHDPGAIRALCSRAILLNNGRMLADGAPIDVLNRYQELIMAREEAYEADSEGLSDENDDVNSLADRVAPELSFTYRHGDRTAEIRRVELLDASARSVELVETGEHLLVKILVFFKTEVEDPVCGFLIRNRHGINLYGTNTQLLNADIGPVSRGEAIEVTFSFNCWLAPGSYSVAVAAHSPAAVSFDWLDGVLYFHVISGVTMEGIANLNAKVSTSRVAKSFRQTRENIPVTQQD